MAWTKVKTAALAGAAILLTASAGVVAVKAVHAARPAAGPDLQGAWEGVVHIEEPGVASGQTAASRMVLKLTKSNEVYSGTVDWIDKGRADHRVGEVEYDYPDLKLIWGPKKVWDLTVKPDGTELIWDYRVNFVVPDAVVLRRTDAPDPVPGRLEEAEFAPRAGSALQGYWKGTIGAGQVALPVNMKIAEKTDGAFRAEADNPMQGANGTPATVTFSRPAVKLTLASGGGMFEGEINSGNSEITGAWTQGGQSLPASVKRADFHAEHIGDADKDYSSTSRGDLQGHWKGSWEFMKTPVPVALDIARLPDGSYEAISMIRSSRMRACISRRISIIRAMC